jgi:predicted MPP superfamily phosphohydrolase
VFLLTYAAVYLGLHAHVLLHVHRAVGLRPLSMALAIFGCLCAVVAPVVAWRPDRRRREVLAKTVGIAAFAWMGFLLLVFTVLVGLDLLRLGAWGLSFAGLRAPVAWLAQPGAVVGCVGIAGAAAVYGWFEARDLRVERVQIATERLPPELPALRIVHISDVHVGFMNGVQRMRPLVERIRELQPDLVVSTGDFVDSQTGLRSEVRRFLAELRAPLGKFAVLGNHELYMGLPAVEFLKGAGFRVLRNEGVSVAGNVWIAGVDDPASDLQEEPLPPPAGAYRILLKHRPTVSDNPVPFDLQLSGHTHGGQIFPFGLVVSRFYPLRDGLTGHGDRYVYKSRGSGSWGPPFRLLAPPEITLFELVRKSCPSSGAGEATNAP